MKTKITRAGVIPYFLYENNIKMLFMKPSNEKYGGECFQIAKGKVDYGEDILFAAFREAKEELGLISENIIYYEYIGVYLKTINLYICKIKNPNNFIETTDETKETKWLTLEEFKTIGRELHIPVVEKAHKLIKSVYIKQPYLI